MTTSAALLVTAPKLTYKVTKRFSVKRTAQAAGLILAGWTGQADSAFKVTKTGPREWTLQGFIKDLDLDGERGEDIRHVLQVDGAYGMETFTS